MRLKSIKLVRFLLQCTLQAIRPFLGPPAHCVYALSCTKFALYQLEHAPLHEAFWSITKRLLSCNPITSLLLMYTKQ